MRRVEFDPSLIRDLKTLTPYIGEGVLLRAASGPNGFEIPAKGPGYYSIPNGLRRKSLEEKNTPEEISPSDPNAKNRRRQWNTTHRL